MKRNKQMGGVLYKLQMRRNSQRKLTFGSLRNLVFKQVHLSSFISSVKALLVWDYMWEESLNKIADECLWFEVQHNLWHCLAKFIVIMLQDNQYCAHAWIDFNLFSFSVHTQFWMRWKTTEYGFLRMKLIKSLIIYILL